MKRYHVVEGPPVNLGMKPENKNGHSVQSLCGYSLFRYIGMDKGSPPTPRYEQVAIYIESLAVANLLKNSIEVAEAHND